MVIVPKDRRYKVNHSTDVFGQIVDTRNMDFDKEGYMALARKPIGLYTEAQNAEFNLPVQIVANPSGEYDIITPGEMFSMDVDNSLTVTEDVDEADSPTFANGSDAVYFAGILVASGTTKVSSRAASNWTDRITGLSSSYGHPLCVVENRNELAVGNGNTVKFYDTSWSLQVTLTLPSEFEVVWIRYVGNDVFVGTKNTSGRHARVFKTDGVSTAAEDGYSVKADWAFSGCEHDSSLVVLNSVGQVLRFNGGGFDVLGEEIGIPAVFPIFSSPYQWNSNTNGETIGKCAQRGMASDGDILYFNIDGSFDASNTLEGHTLPTQPSGLWVYDKEVGLYHRGGYVFERHTVATPTTVASSHLVFSSAHGLETGDPVLCRVIGSLTGLVAGRDYYAIVDDTTSLSLAMSPANAKAGIVITVGGSVTSSSFAFNKYTGVSSIDDATPGAVCVLTNDPLKSFYGSNVLYGADVLINDGATRYGVIMSLGTGRNVGSATTARIHGRGVLDNNQKLFVKFRGINLDTDAIELKTRTRDRYGLPTASASSDGFITWVSGTQFTVSSVYRALAQVEDGDEVEFLHGTGAGRTAHVSAIDKTSALYTVTLDRTIPGVTAGDEGDVVFYNWKKLGTITNDSAEVARGYAEFPVGIVSGWIEVKAEQRGFGVCIEDMKFINAEHKKNG